MSHHIDIFPCALVEARIPVPDPRFDWLAETYASVSRIPAFLTCIDIAGLTAVRVFPTQNFFVCVLRDVVLLGCLDGGWAGKLVPITRPIR